MTQTGTVNEIRGDMVVVGCSSEVCESCSGTFCRPDRRSVEARNSNGLPLRVGDRVDIYLAPAKTIAAGFMALMVPLILFVVLYLVGGAMFGAEREGARAVCGLGGLAAGFGLSALYGKLQPGRQYPLVSAVKERPSAGVLTSGDSQPAR